HAPDERIADRHADDLAGAPDLVALADRFVLAEQRDADVVLLEVQDHAHDGVAAVAAEFDQLAGHGAGQAVDARDAVAGGQDRAGLHDRDLLVEVLDLLADDAADLFGLDLHVPFLARQEPLAHELELGPDAAVVDHVADLGDHTAEERRVLLLLEHDLLAGGL